MELETAALQAVGVYQLLGSLLAKRRVLDVWPLLVDGLGRLEQAGAVPVMAPIADEPPIALEDGSVDVVLCLSGFAGRHSPEAQARWLAEFRRLLKPEGLCVFRVPRTPEGAGNQELLARLGESFARTETVTETPFVGVSFFVSGTDDMAVGGDLQRLASNPSHELVFSTCTAGTWALSESLFIPLDGLGAELARRDAWQRAVDAERDELRETVLQLQEQADRQDAALAAFRRRNARGLQQTSDREGAFESLSLEREQLVERAERAEKAVTDLEAASRRGAMERAMLETELARLRARPDSRPEKAHSRPTPATGAPIPHAKDGSHKSKPPA